MRTATAKEELSKTPGCCRKQPLACTFGICTVLFSMLAADVYARVSRLYREDPQYSDNCGLMELSHHKKMKPNDSHRIICTPRGSVSHYT
jgi:hypothetical protein